MCDINDYRKEYTAVYKCLRTPPDNNENYVGPRCRYFLKKEGDNPLIIIGCNPSTANEGQSDPTMVKVSQFCQIKGYGGYIMLNLYPQIASQVDNLPITINNIYSINIYNFNVQIIEETLKENNKTDILFAFGNIINNRIRLFRECYDGIRDLLIRMINKRDIDELKIKKLISPDEINDEGNYLPHFLAFQFYGIGMENVEMEQFYFRNFNI